MEEKDTQPGAVDLHGEIQTFHAVLNRHSIKESQIEVEKYVNDITDTEENPKGLDIDKFFEFEITVDGANEKDPEIIRVKAGSKAVSRVYTWGEDDPTEEYECPKPYCGMTGKKEKNGKTKIPTYTVKELFEDGSSKVVASGELQDGITVKNKVINKIEPKTGRLLIEKRVIDAVGKLTNVPENVTFTFNVTVKGKFRYYDDETGWRRI